MAESKIQHFNVNKSILMVIGSKKARAKVEKELDANPIMLYGVPMKRKTHEKYLGEILCSGLAESVIATVKKRKGQVMLAINEIASIVSDTRANTIGGIEVATTIWELAVIPYLLNSADTWFGINNKAMEMLNHIHNTFLQRILKVSSACIPLMYWDSGQLLMKNRILKKKLLLTHHLATLDQKSLAFKVFQNMKIQNLPGLIPEIEETLTELGITLSGTSLNCFINY